MRQFWRDPYGGKHAESIITGRCGSSGDSVARPPCYMCRKCPLFRQIRCHRRRSKFSILRPACRAGLSCRQLLITQSGTERMFSSSSWTKRRRREASCARCRRNWRAWPKPKTSNRQVPSFAPPGTQAASFLTLDPSLPLAKPAPSGRVGSHSRGRATSWRPALVS